jgi:hypothetical protein
LSKQRHSASRWLLILTLACVVLLGFYIGKYEVDQKPTPRSLLNLGGAYFAARDMPNALKYWRLCANYNRIYGTRYSYNTWPHGRRIRTCIENLEPFKNFENDPLFHRGKK